MSYAKSTSQLPRPRVHALALYLMSLAACIAIYTLYARFAVPLIEGTPQIVQHNHAPPRIHSPDSQASKHALTQILPSDAWELGPTKTLVTDSGTILFQDFEAVEGGYIEVFPFTLLTHSLKTQSGTQSSQSDASAPTVLRCLRGARLKFDQPAARVFAGKAKMKSARLVGQVDIVKPASQPGSDDSVTLATSNVQIDPHKIFTIDEVNFKIGPNHGRGKNLSIEFAHNPLVHAASHDFSSIEGIRRIELAFVEHLRIESRREGDLAPNGPQSVDSHKQSPTTVRCAGPFSFDLGTGQANFHDQVVVEMENEYRDRIECDQLTIQFSNSQPTKRLTLPRSVSQSSSSTARLQLQRLIAVGRPALVFSAEREAKLTGDVLDYDPINQTIQAVQKFDQPVTLVSPEYHAVAQQISYRLPEEKALGTLTALGPGKMLRMADSKQDQIFVEWGQRLDTVTQDGQLHVRLTGGCKARLDANTQLASRQIDVWLKQMAANPTNTDTPAPIGNSSTTAAAYSPNSQSENSSWQPTRIVARDEVDVRSARFQGTTQLLTATWSGEPATQDSSLPSLNSSPRSASTSPIQRHLKPSVSESPQKFKFLANEVNLNLKHDGQQTRVAELQANGNVSISEIIPKQLDSKPGLSVSGDTLRLIPQSNEKVRLRVTGSPTNLASVIHDSMRLMGEQLHLDQQANKLWIDGAGELHVTQAAMNQHITRAASLQNSGFNESSSFPRRRESSDLTNGQAASPSNEPSLAVQWTGGMIFDGHKIYFEDGIRMTAEDLQDNQNLTRTQATCAGLSLKLSRSISFDNLSTDNASNSPAADPEIEEMILVDQIHPDKRVFHRPQTPLAPTPSPTENLKSASILHQTFDTNRQLIEQQQFISTQATFDAVNNQITARGPGIITHHGTSSPADESKIAGSSLGEPNTRLASVVRKSTPDSGFASNDEINFVQVKFDSTAEVELKKQQMKIQGNVRTLYATVPNFETSLDPDRFEPDQIATDDAVKIACDQLKFAQWTPRGQETPTQEFVATGNAHVEGPQFEATANRVSFNRAQDMLIVEGTPRSDANLWFRRVPHARQRDHLVAGKILYRPSDQWTEIQSVKNVSIKQ